MWYPQKGPEKIDKKSAGVITDRQTLVKKETHCGNVR